MTVRILGAILIIFSCGAFGFMISSNRKREENSLRKLVSALDYMECELQYRMSALPDLCRSTAAECTGAIQCVFSALARELEDQISPDVRWCMRAALSKVKNLPKQTKECFSLLGDSLGRFDMNGQLKGLEAVRNECRRRIGVISTNNEGIVRSYQTLGICAGAALVILLM